MHRDTAAVHVRERSLWVSSAVLCSEECFQPSATVCTFLVVVMNCHLRNIRGAAKQARPPVLGAVQSWPCCVDVGVCMVVWLAMHSH